MNALTNKLSDRKIEIGMTTFGLGLMAIIFLAQIVLSFDWLIQADAAVLHYIAYLINEHDFVPYRDLFEPNILGSYFFHMAIGGLFGYSDIAFRWVDLAWMTATLAVTWFVMLPAGRTVALAGCLLFGLAYLNGGPALSLQRDVIAILPLAIALLLVTRRQAKRSKPIFSFFVGVFVAIAALFKPPLAIGLPALLLFLCWEPEDDQFSFSRLIMLCFETGLIALAGFIVVVSAPFIWVWRLEGIPQFVSIVLSYIPLYAAISNEFEILSGGERFLYLIREFLKFDGLGMLVIGPLFASYIVLNAAKTRAAKRLSVLLVVMAVLYSVYAGMSGKFWHYHWMPFIYFASLGSSMLLFRYGEPDRQRKSNSPAILGFFIIALVIGHPGLTILNQIKHGEPIPPSEGRVEDLAAYLKTNLSPGDTVQPLDWIGGSLNAMLRSEAVLATPYIVDLQFYHHVSNPYIQKIRKDFIQRLETGKPKFIINMHEKAILKGREVSYEYPELDNYIQQYYRRDYQGDGFDVYRRIGYYP